MNSEVGIKYILTGASQYGRQWDESKFDIQPSEIVTKVTKRPFRDDLFRVESDGRVVKIGKSIIGRYFKELEE